MSPCNGEMDGSGLVSMKSGLGDRNNVEYLGRVDRGGPGVSMKSGLGDRNNGTGYRAGPRGPHMVSMKSGLGDRNNSYWPRRAQPQAYVSMKSGLGDRNNPSRPTARHRRRIRLNEVRSWRPEQFTLTSYNGKTVMLSQ